MSQPEQKVFDLFEGRSRKEHGMDVAAEAKMSDLARARMIAIELAKGHPLGECDADMVGRELSKRGYPSSLGPAAGSLFKTDNWEFTGKRRLSHRKTNHARELKVWRLVGLK